MNEMTMSLFDLLPEEEAAQYKPKKSTDWKWTFADYPCGAKMAAKKDDKS